ncbi:TorA maturation chaperone TorD [Desulfitispora alkaliphila]|uniref:TorD/DmsD family molecular chaperone n=1 Tax=Desulfitispora alkaliphila TaxID=622674 RepID=UPI003D1B2B7B
MVFLEQKQSMQQLFSIAAEFYKFPDRDFYNQLASGDLFQELEKLSTKAGFAPSNLAWPVSVPSLHQLQQEHLRCFMGFNSQAAVPIESLYKRWTVDPTAKLTIASQKGYLMGDAAVHIHYLLDSLGLEIPSEYQQKPDHLAILLEILAYLITERNEREVELYISEHLDWLPHLKLRLIEIDAHPLFVTMTEQLIHMTAQAKWLYKDTEAICY